uniref:Uncharacterized protein n=1 Tax=Ixodes ricinus TaxID=34613 RepID=A0A6B0UI78_IXORI
MAAVLFFFPSIGIGTYFISQYSMCVLILVILMIFAQFLYVEHAPIIIYAIFLCFQKFLCLACFYFQCKFLVLEPAKHMVVISGAMFLSGTTSKVRCKF